MTAAQIKNSRVVGALNGEAGTVVDARDPSTESQGSGIDCLVHWDAAELEDSWEDAGDLEFE